MQGTLLNLNPLVAIFDDVFDEKTANAVIAAGRDDLSPAAYISENEIVIGEKRTNTSAFVDQWAHPELTELATKISSILRLPPENSEPAKLLHYVDDQYFDIHNDAFGDDDPSRNQLARGGQRIFTSLSYLNDVPSDGQTAFPMLKLAVRPKLGRVLIFSNTVPGQIRAHQDSKHTGFGVPDGEKWVLSLWWRERNYHVPRDYPETEGEFREY
ncbi:MAG: 2OG-Fe(II) oxygenase [Paracoccaceae bacterium]|nr:2OG-Fe(II) oxygenase [Paracoccaceae bacterium]